MSKMPAICEDEADDVVRQQFGRLKDSLGLDRVPLAFQIYAQAPAFLQDFQMNFRKFVWQDGKLDGKTKALLAFIVSVVKECQWWREWMADRCRHLGWSDQELTDAIGVAATCVGFNTLYKFRDLAGTDIFQGMSPGLRAHAMLPASLTKATAELIEVVVSDLNACKPCTTGHVGALRAMNVGDEAIHEAVQCAAVMSAGITFLLAAGIE